MVHLSFCTFALTVKDKNDIFKVKLHVLKIQLNTSTWAAVALHRLALRTRTAWSLNTTQIFLWSYLLSVEAIMVRQRTSREGLTATTALPRDMRNWPRGEPGWRHWPDKSCCRGSGKPWGLLAESQQTSNMQLVPLKALDQQSSALCWNLRKHQGNGAICSHTRQNVKYGFPGNKDPYYCVFKYLIKIDLNT